MDRLLPERAERARGGLWWQCAARPSLADAAAATAVRSECAIAASRLTATEEGGVYRQRGGSSSPVQSDTHTHDNSAQPPTQH